ncbi:MAG: hypothetical protein V4665_04740 [Patescibacteria group bacterium]
MKDNRQAVAMLQSIMPLLMTVKAEVSAIKEKFSEIAYYQNFKFHVHRPSKIPLEAVDEFILFINNAKEEFLTFKESFNENDLPDEARKNFVKIMLLICQNGLEYKNGYAHVGGISGTWVKPVSYVLERWDSMEYVIKVAYSQQAYNVISGYFNLIDCIQLLENDLKLLFNRH